MQAQMTFDRRMLVNGTSVIAAALMVALALALAVAGIQQTSAAIVVPEVLIDRSAEPSSALMAERAHAIADLRSQNVASFDAMEQAPALYTGENSVGSVDADVHALIQELRELNLANFEAMERSPGLYTGN